MGVGVEAAGSDMAVERVVCVDGRGCLLAVGNKDAHARDAFEKAVVQLLLDVQSAEQRHGQPLAGFCEDVRAVGQVGQTLLKVLHRKLDDNHGRGGCQIFLADVEEDFGRATFIAVVDLVVEPLGDHRVVKRAEPAVASPICWGSHWELAGSAKEEVVGCNPPGMSGTVNAGLAHTCGTSCPKRRKRMSRETVGSADVVDDFGPTPLELVVGDVGVVRRVENGVSGRGE